MQPWLQHNYEYPKARICIIPNERAAAIKKYNGINTVTGTQCGRGASITPD